MHGRLLTIITITIILLAGCGQVEKADVAADLVITNATIYTVDPEFSVVDAMAIKDGKILATGSNEEMRAYYHGEAVMMDLEGATVLPGLIDAHAHLIGYATNLDRLNVGDQESLADVLALVREKAEETPEGQWITGRGWDQNDWNDASGFPTAAMLDEVSPENPVMLTRVDGHAIWVNSRAMEMAGINSETRAPEGGEIIRAEGGAPTGIFVDTAEGLVARHVPRPPMDRVEELLSEALVHMHSVGLTGSHEMGGSSAVTDMIRAMIERDSFDFRLAMYYSSTLPDIEALMADNKQTFGEHQLVIAGMKAYADGALGSRGAAMKEPYSDRAETSGLVITEQDRLEELTELALSNEMQIATHAIGDLANHIVLNAYENALAASSYDDHRSRVEHAQIIAPEDMHRFSKLGVLPSMQPTHCTSDFPWALDRIGEERAEGAYAWRTLIDYGNYIPCGSDFPVEAINPFYGLYSAITRQHQDGTPVGGYFPEERMTRKEALQGFTIWAAQAAFMEDVVGSLEAGKYADFIIVDTDVMTAPENEIHSAEVVQTWMAGEMVYQRKETDE